MKLASANMGRDGRLLLVSRDLTRAVLAPVATMQAALDDWRRLRPLLAAAAEALERGEAAGCFPFDPGHCAAPLPRAFAWLDASAYLSHVERVRSARGAAMPAELYDDPLMYQGGSDILLGPRDPIPCQDPSWGLDLEAEIAVILGDVAMGTGPEAALAGIRLVTLANDVSLRGLIPAELSKGFGFVQGKPPSAFAPVAVTPDDLGPAWAGGRLSGRLRVTVRGKALGDLDPGLDMAFDFGRLIAHAARTRPLGAGTIIGSGTVSARDAGRGVACLVERRVIEQTEQGAPVTPFLAPGDRVTIEMVDAAGRSLFGAIDQAVISWPPRSGGAGGGDAEAV